MLFSIRISELLTPPLWTPPLQCNICPSNNKGRNILRLSKYLDCPLYPQRFYVPLWLQSFCLGLTTLIKATASPAAGEAASAAHALPRHLPSRGAQPRGPHLPPAKVLPRPPFRGGASPGGGPWAPGAPRTGPSAAAPVERQPQDVRALVQGAFLFKKMLSFIF